MYGPKTSFLVFVLFAFGCASAPKPEKDFPTPQELEAILAKPVAETAPGQPREMQWVETWQLVGPQPQLIGAVARAPQNALEEALVAAGYGLTESTHCAAREMAAFIAANGGWPSPALQEYIDGWCGNTTESVVRWKVAELDPTTDPVRAAAWLDNLKKLPPQPGRDIGVVHNAEKGETFMYLANREVNIEPIPLVEDADTFEIRGTFIGDSQERFDSAYALITRGPYDFEYCTTDHTVALPAFVVRCPVLHEATRFAMSAGLTVSEEVGEGLWSGVRFRTDPGLAYRAPVLPEFPELSKDRIAAKKQFVAALNELRMQARLKPLVFAEEQSKLIERAVPHFRAASALEQYDLVDDIISGLRAGWHIDGPVLDASWASRTVVRTNPRGIFEYLVVSPSHRRLIYHPDAAAIAFQFNWLDDERTAADVFGMTYFFVPEEHYNRTVGRAYDRLDELRAQAGRGPAKRLHIFNTDMKEICEAVAAGRMSRDKAHRKVGALPYGRTDARSWRYWSATTSNLAKTGFSDSMIQKEELEVAMCATPFREPGSPWYQYVILTFWLKD